MSFNQIAKNFNRQEFSCRGGDSCCGGSSPISLELVELVQNLRDELGTPLHINSGFRCNVHNANIGGVPESYHTLGMACDIAVPDELTIGEFESAIKAHFYGGIGLYRDKNFVHVDIREGYTEWEG